MSTRAPPCRDPGPPCGFHAQQPGAADPCPVVHHGRCCIDFDGFSACVTGLEALFSESLSLSPSQFAAGAGGQGQVGWWSQEDLLGEAGHTQATPKVRDCLSWRLQMLLPHQ